MARLSNLERALAVGQIQAGKSQREVARDFGISQSTVSALVNRYHQTGDVKDRPRAGRPRFTTAATDEFIRTTALCRRTVAAIEIQNDIHEQGNRRLSRQTIHNIG